MNAEMDWGRCPHCPHTPPAGTRLTELQAERRRQGAEACGVCACKTCRGTGRLDAERAQWRETAWCLLRWRLEHSLSPREASQRAGVSTLQYLAAEDWLCDPAPVLGALRGVRDSSPPVDERSR